MDHPDQERIVVTTAEILNTKKTCLTVRAELEPVGETTRFQPAGFPEIGHVIYKSPIGDGRTEDVCIVDSAASMANHLETVCLAGGESIDLHEDLTGLPYVACVTQEGDDERVVCTSFTEGHRLASDYFLKATVGEKSFREILRKKMQLKELTKDKKYFFYPDSWPEIYSTIFRYDPNSLVHGLLFAREEIKISRVLTAHHEGHGAQRVLSSGVKFDRLGKTLSGQPIFAVDEETAQKIVATFTIDLGLIRSYGRGERGLSNNNKLLLLELALWKVCQLTGRPFRFRSGCHLKLKGNLTWHLDNQTIDSPSFDLGARIKDCVDSFEASPTKVFYPAVELYRVESPKEKKAKAAAKAEAGESEEE
jgi:CRISPR-associated protein Csb1